MPNKEQEKTENVQKKSTESNPSTTKEKEDKAVEQAIATVMHDGDIPHDPSRIFLDLKYEFEDSPFISEKRAEAELNKFMREYREKEDKENKAVEQAIAKVMNDRDIPQSRMGVRSYLKYELNNNSDISKKRAEAELKKFQSECRTEAEFGKFISEYREKEDKENKAVEQVEKEDKENKAVEQAIATVMHDGDITHDPSRIFLDLKYEFEDSPFISEKRAEAELNKFMREYREKEDKENKAVEQVMTTVMNDRDISQSRMGVGRYLKSGLKNNSDISEKRAEAELKKFQSECRTEAEFGKFISEYREKENEAVEQVIETVMNDKNMPQSRIGVWISLESELKNNSGISEKRAEAELKKFQSECRTEAELRKLKSKYKINRDDTNSLHVPTNKDRRENLKEKLNRVSKEENSSPKRAAVSQDLQHKQDNPLHR